MTTMPSRNTEGNQVWNPSVGVYFKPDADQRQSYGGIIGALNDSITLQGGANKAYPHNFAGIISAIENLTFTQKGIPVTVSGTQPTSPTNGELWFNTTQEQLFVAVDGEYQQTNGLAQVTDAIAPDTPTIGQFWWDTSTNSLYIFDGFWLDQDDEIKEIYEPGYTPVWRLVQSADGVNQTTLTLPLGDLDTNQTGLILPDPQAGTMDVQGDYNKWIFNALEALETAIESGNYSSVQVDMEVAPPANPSPGDFWYDTTSLDLNIWYEDDNTGQWVPTAALNNYNTEFADIYRKILIEENARSQQISSLQSQINVISQRDLNELRLIESRIQELKTEVISQSAVDLTGYVTDIELAQEVESLTRSINSVKNLVPAKGSCATKQELAGLTADINKLPTTKEVNQAIALATPDLSEYVKQSDIDNSIQNITTDYLPRSGGVVNGSFVINKAEVTLPAFDFSTDKWNGRISHKYLTQSYGDESNYVTFGTNDKPWQYAWAFNADEDFCWMYNDTDKVFSITKEGPACSQLYIGDLQKDNNNGRQIFNKIDVKDRLIKYQSAFTALRHGVASATDFDELKANILSSLNSI